MTSRERRVRQSLPINDCYSRVIDNYAHPSKDTRTGPSERRETTWAQLRMVVDWEIEHGDDQYTQVLLTGLRRPKASAEELAEAIADDPKFSRNVHPNNINAAAVIAARVAIERMK